MMKKSTLFALIILFHLEIYAQETRYINFLSAREDVCLAVTVKHSRGQFTFSSNHFRVDGPKDYVEDWDCKGRKILDTTPDRGGGYSTDKSKPVVFEYIFKTLLQAQRELGRMFASGEGCEKDLVAARYWLIRAREAGEEAGNDFIRDVAKSYIEELNK